MLHSHNLAVGEIHDGDVAKRSLSILELRGLSNVDSKEIAYLLSRASFVFRKYCVFQSYAAFHIRQGQGLHIWMHVSCLLGLFSVIGTLLPIISVNAELSLSRSIDNGSRGRCLHFRALGQGDTIGGLRWGRK